MSDCDDPLHRYQNAVVNEASTPFGTPFAGSSIPSPLKAVICLELETFKQTPVKMFGMNFDRIKFFGMRGAKIDRS